MRLVRSAILAAVLFATAVSAQQYPKPTGYVNDFANLLTREQGASLNDELAAFEKKTAIEIAVVTVLRLNSRSIEDYARGLAKEWGVGKRGQNNGVVFLVAPKERKMRIETASGAHVFLTDSRADWIRDNAVLPRFRAGNMAQGIIDGTHEIMRVLDVGAIPAVSENGVASAPQPIPRERTSEDMRVLVYVLGGIAGVIVVLSIILPPIGRSRARKYVLETRGEVALRFIEAEKAARSSDVKEKTRKKVAQLKGEFSLIGRLTATSGVNWIKTREKLDSVNYSLPWVVLDMEREVAFAEKARKEGPELMKKIPGMIEAAEKKIVDEGQTPQAVKYLAEARTQYARAQDQAAGITTIDWVALYLILSEIQSSIADAESSRVSPSDSRSSSSRSSDHDGGSTSYGFGDSGGFGGGGGFDGSGSSGSW